MELLIFERKSIIIRLQCDGEDDCLDGSDEVDASGKKCYEEVFELFEFPPKFRST